MLYKQIKKEAPGFQELFIFVTKLTFFWYLGNIETNISLDHAVSETKELVIPSRHHKFSLLVNTVDVVDDVPAGLGLVWIPYVELLRDGARAKVFVNLKLNLFFIRKQQIFIYLVMRLFLEI